MAKKMKKSIAQIASAKKVGNKAQSVTSFTVNGFTIYRGITFKAGNSGRPLGVGRKYPWKEVQIGDSFLSAAGLSSACGLYMGAKKQGVKVAIQREGDAFRVLRIA